MKYFYLSFFFLYLTISCIFTHTDVRTYEDNEVRVHTSTTVRSPAKAYLADGSVILYPEGFTTLDATIITSGLKYNLTRTRSSLVENVALDRVKYLEYYNREMDGYAFLASVKSYLYCRNCNTLRHAQGDAVVMLSLSKQDITELTRH